MKFSIAFASVLFGLVDLAQPGLAADVDPAVLEAAVKCNNL